MEDRKREEGRKREKKIRWREEGTGKERGKKNREEDSFFSMHMETRN